MSDKNIPLSELIRIGSKVSKQCYSTLYRQSTNSTCTIGAAYVGKHGEPPGNISTNDALRECGFDPLEKVSNPTDGKSLYLSGVICQLNDTAKWTREQIAEWLASQGM